MPGLTHPDTQAGYPKKLLVGVCVAFLLTLTFFWPTIASFPGTWARYGMHHGWAVAGFVIWLAWRDRAQLMTGSTGAPWAMIPLAALSLFWFVATVAHVQLFHQAAFLFVVACWGFVVFGLDAARTLVAVVVTFLLALPFWEVLVPILRPITTLTSAGLVRMLGISAVIEGDIIHIDAGSFLIADGCAGLSYLLAGMVTGTCYAFLFLRRWPSQLAVVGLAAAISVVGNWVRVAMVIVIGHATEMQSVIIENHGMLGWIIFTVGLVPLFIIAGRMEKGVPGIAAGADPEPEHEAGVRDEVLETKQGREEAERRMLRVGGATTLAALGPIFFFPFGALPAVEPDELSLSELALGDQWRMEEAPEEQPSRWRPAYQGAEEEDTWTFTDGTAQVYVDHFVYRTQAQGAKLVGHPNAIARSSDLVEDRLMGPLGPSRVRWVRQALVRTPEGPILTWYWYRVGGVDTFSPVYAKILEVPSFLARHRVSELIALSVACAPDNCTNALEALAGFMGARRSDSSGNPLRQE